MDLERIKKVYIIGIEGAGTSALARMFRNQGVEVSGSDDGDHFYADVLAGNDIKVFESFDVKNIPTDTDLIVHSIAFNPKTNVEVAAAARGDKPLMTYGEAVAMFFNAKFGISVCGTHGKTTTTAWLAFVLDRAGYSPNMVVGAKVPQLEGNTLVGKSEYFVMESDEYGNKLAFLHPRAALLNNIDYDHPDFFPSHDEYLAVFVDFIKKMPKNSWLVANFDDKNIRKIVNVNFRGKVISYAINEAADYVAYDIRQAKGRQYFKVKLGSDSFLDEDEAELLDEDLGDFSVSLLGQHNVLNALAVIASAIELGVELVDIRKYLAEFTGTNRRLEVMGKFNGAVIIDDYAHHPSEIKATLSGLRDAHKDDKIIVVFHPHTFTRTKALLDDFATSFNNIDELIVLDIYGSAREKQGGIHSLDLVAKIQEKNQDLSVRHIPDMISVEEYLRKHIGRKDIVVMMGAGDVFKIGMSLVE